MTVTIANKTINEESPVFIIGEIGINHNGDVETAKKLIDVSVNAGCDAVKFQKRTVDVVYSKEELDKPRESPWGTTNREQKHGLEFGEKEYSEIDEYCKEKGILWSASPWDEESVDFLEKFNVPFYKIASASLTDDELLKKVKSAGKPVILSTGMSSMEEIKNAVKVLGTEGLILLHCTSTYPSKPEELNLNVIKTLKKEFPNVPVGYSGHESNVTPSVIACALGACVLERHITLDKTMYGSDQAASIEPSELESLVKEVRSLKQVLGDGRKTVYESEIPIREKLRRK